MNNIIVLLKPRFDIGVALLSQLHGSLLSGFHYSFFHSLTQFYAVGRRRRPWGWESRKNSGISIFVDPNVYILIMHNLQSCHNFIKLHFFNGKNVKTFEVLSYLNCTLYAPLFLFDVIGVRSLRSRNGEEAPVNRKVVSIMMAMMIRNFSRAKMCGGKFEFLKLFTDFVLSKAQVDEVGTRRLRRTRDSVWIVSVQ